MQSVDCIIVTFNKINFLKECLIAVLGQTIMPNRIIVIDNNSTDGTKKYLKNISKENGLIVPIFLEKNVGGAGGFYEGVKYCCRHVPSDFFWMMDDDTIPEKRALEFLIEKASPQVGFCASNIKWVDGSAALMNVPGFSRDANNTNFSDAVKITRASFVSLLINYNAVKVIGLPIKEFFIWGDDVEFTLRISNANFVNYLCLKSIALHKMKVNEEVDILNENDEIGRINRYFYEYRNSVYRLKKQGLVFLSRDLIKRLKTIFNLIFGKSRYKRKKIFIIVKGTFLGIFFNPKIKTIKDVTK